MSESALRAIERCVNAHAGLRLPGWVLAARVRDRVAVLALRDADEYLRVLEGARGPDELDHLAEALRVGETRFYRHAAHVNALARVVDVVVSERRGGGGGGGAGGRTASVSSPSRLKPRTDSSR